jgi:hypothetical protein
MKWENDIYSIIYIDNNNNSDDKMLSMLKNGKVSQEEVIDFINNRN